MTLEVPPPGGQELEKLAFKAGETIFEQGAPAAQAYILDSGQVSMRQRHDGQVVEMDLISPGEVFGEMAVLAGGTRHATALATEDSVVTVIPAPLFAERLDQADGFIRGIIGKFIQDIRTSYRSFLRRPRSMRDHIRQMAGFSRTLKRFAGRVSTQDEQLSMRMVASLRRLEAELDELNAIANLVVDGRRDVIMDDDETAGVPFRAVVDSEQRRGTMGKK
jgi:CRP-like cAMP-binding protein